MMTNREDDRTTTTTMIRCFNGYHRPFLDPNELTISIRREGQGQYDINELRSYWEENFPHHYHHQQQQSHQQSSNHHHDDPDIDDHASSSSSIPVRLIVEFKENWSRFGGGSWWYQFCAFIKEISSQLGSFCTTFDRQIDDEEWALLLRQLPSHLSELSITTENCNSPLAYQEIGRRFPSLESLYIYHGEGCPLLLARKTLPRVLLCLPILKRLTLWNLPISNHGIRWKDFVDAIQQVETLEEVNVFQGYTAQGRAIIPLSDNELEAIQYYPRINEAKKKIGSNGHTTNDVCNNNLPTRLEDFVEVILSVHDRLDCLQYFFLQVDPNLYAHAAIANLLVGKQE